MFQCPVCGYAGLRSKPYETWPPPPNLQLSPPYENQLGAPSYEVCPRCGFEFGNDDNPGTSEPVTFEAHRLEWEADGSPWFDPEIRRIAEHTTQPDGGPVEEKDE